MVREGRLPSGEWRRVVDAGHTFTVAYRRGPPRTRLPPHREYSPMPAEEPEVKAPAEEIEENPVLEDMPVLTVRDTVIYPGALLPITVGRPSSLALVQSLGENRTLAVISQLDPRVESPGPGDLYALGTVCVMHKAIKVPKDNLLLFCEGIARIRTREFTATEPFLRQTVVTLFQ